MEIKVSKPMHSGAVVNTSTTKMVYQKTGAVQPKNIRSFTDKSTNSKIFSQSRASLPVDSIPSLLKYDNFLQKQGQKSPSSVRRNQRIQDTTDVEKFNQRAN